MAMVIARMADQFSSMQQAQPKMAGGVTEADLDEYKDLVDNLISEFEGEIARIKGDVNKAHNRLDDVEKRLGALERVRKTI
jgi:flagellar biosynthesis chaperone FliJ